MADITLVTYVDMPDLAPDDRLLAEVIQAKGFSVRSAVWSDPNVDWSLSGLTVLRSTWDYFHRVPEFLAWLDRVEPQTRLENSAELVRWNHHKHYLRSLAEGGVAIVPTYFADPFASVSLRQEADRLGAQEIVIKPAVAGAAFGARRFDLTTEMASAILHLDGLLCRGAAMIQPFLPSVLDVRERALIYFDGEFSHGYLKPPFSAGVLGGESGEAAYGPTAKERSLAAKALSASGFKPLYARVDIVLANDEPLLMELELIEPALHFHIAHGAAARLADLLIAELMQPKVGKVQGRTVERQ